MKSIELKIKSKSLAEEAVIIRNEERKLKTQRIWLAMCQQDASGVNNTWHSINIHRRFGVRNESRATLLARAYLADVPYSAVEASRKVEKELTFKQYVLPRALTMINKYGRKSLKIDDIESWAAIVCS